jgi:4-carboxymuconolactone decarboxylase
VRGAEHVARSLAHATEFDREFQEYITRAAWGEIWTRPGLSIPTRHLLTIALLAALNRPEELALHLEATSNTGVSPQELKEALMHVAVYAGVPAANAAMKTAKRILAERSAQRSDPGGSRG